MTILYKLTDSEGYTYNQCLWGEGVSHSGTGKGELCGPGFIHAYTSPLLAVFLNPIHADIRNPLLWECEGEIAKSDHGLKVGCVTLTTLRQIEIPVVTTEMRVRFAILCAKQVCQASDWNAWADKWLSGEDRTEKAALCAALAAAWAARGRKLVDLNTLAQAAYDGEKKL